MKVKNEYERIPSLEVWNMVVSYVYKNKQFISSTGVKYVASVVEDAIDYKCGSVNKKEPEGGSMSKRFFVSAYNEVRRLECINAKNVKPYMDGKQSPFVGLLKCAGIIE